MHKNTKRLAVAAGITSTTVLVAGVAYAFYAGAGVTASPLDSGASIGSPTVQDLTTTLKTGASGLVPGAAASTIVVTVSNPNAFSVKIASAKTLTLNFAGATVDESHPLCTPSVAQLSADPVTVPATTILAAKDAANSTADFTFLNVKMADDTATDQSACRGASFDIPVIVSS